MTPKVSIIIANFNGGVFVEEALKSALAQTLQEIEVVIVDNCSTDGCFERIKAMAAEDTRLRVYQTEVNSGGPSVPRNTALDQARGEWIAIMDADDLMAPTRIATMLANAERDHADIVADDLCIFRDGSDQTSRCLLKETPFWIDLVHYIRSNIFYGAEPPMGLLKPLIRADLLKDVRYRPDLHMAEDWDLIVRLLLRGAKMKAYPDQTYYYRKHDSSISHRLTMDQLTQTLHFSEVLMREHHSPPEVSDALNSRHQALLVALAFNELVLAIKNKAYGKSIMIGLRNPRAVKLLSMPLMVRLHKVGAFLGINRRRLTYQSI